MNKYKDKHRINYILDKLERIAHLDFSGRLKINAITDEIDALSVGVNMLSEEIEFSLREKEKTAQKQVNLLQQLDDNSPLGSMVVHIENRSDITSLKIVIINDACEDALGIIKENIIGKTILQAFPLLYDDYPVIIDGLKKAIEGAELTLNRVGLNSSNSLPSYFNVKICPLDNDYIFLSFENITKRNEVERKLKKVENSILNSIIFSQENTRKEVSKKHHVGLAQTLFVLKFHMEYINKNVRNSKDKELRESVKVVREYIERSITEIKSLALDLMPISLVEEGLSASIRNHINDSEYKYNVQLESNINDEKIGYDIRIVMFRAISGILDKASEFTKVKKIKVQLLNGASVSCKIEIWGGFNIEINNDGEIVEEEFKVSEKRINLMGGSVYSVYDKNLGVTTILMKVSL